MTAFRVAGWVTLFTLGQLLLGALLGRWLRTRQPEKDNWMDGNW